MKARGWLRNLEIGGGVFVAGERAGDLQNTFTLDSYVTLDAFATYAITENIKASVNARNLLDEEYIEAADGQFEVYPGAPRSVFVELIAHF